MKMAVIPIVIDALGTIPKRLVKGLEELEIRGQEETIQTTERYQDTPKSSGDLKRLAVTQTPVRNYQLFLV